MSIFSVYICCLTFQGRAHTISDKPSSKLELANFELGNIIKGECSVMNRKSFILIVTLFALGVFYPGVASAGEGVLSDWAGDWTSTASYLDAPEYNAVYKGIQKHLPGYTVKGVKGAYQNMYHTDFAKMKVSGDGITFILEDGKELETVIYESRPTPEGKEWEGWSLFEAAEKDSSETRAFVPRRDARFLIALHPHAHGDGPKHWHLRYGKESFEVLLALKDWWGTGLEPAATAAQLTAGIDPAEYSKYLAKPLSEWRGEWISSLKLMQSPLMDPIFEAIAAEAKKLGKNYTAAEVRSFNEKNYATDWDRLVVTDSEFHFKKDDGTLVAACKVINDGLLAGWYALKGDQPGYKNIVASRVHGSGSGKHWHLRCSGEKTAEELRESKDGTPTGYDPALITPELYAESWKKAVVSRAKMLPEKK